MSDTPAFVGGEEGEKVQKQMEALVLNLSELMTSVEDFQSDSQPVLDLKFSKSYLMKKREEYMTKLKELALLAESPYCLGTQIPCDVLRLLDEGKHPYTNTFDSIEECFATNRSWKGKVVAIQALKDQLEEEMTRTFPEEQFPVSECTLSFPPPDPSDHSGSNKVNGGEW